jgi:hypothetical protein
MSDEPQSPPKESPTAEAYRVLCAAVEDMDQKMTRYGDEQGEWVTAYIVPASPWHRILGLVRGGLWPSFVEERLTPPPAAEP